MRKKLLIILMILALFLTGCGEKEPSLIEQARIMEEARLAQEALEANKTSELSMPKEVIPIDFLESCIYNQKIEFFKNHEDKELCINVEGKLVVNIKNIGFDPVNSIKLVFGTKEIVSEEKNLGAGKMRIYRFDDISLEGIKTIIAIPRGKFYDGKIYDCKKSQLSYEVKNILNCVN